MYKLILILFSLYRDCVLINPVLYFRFIGMKFKAVTFIDSTFQSCYFEDVSSVGSFFKNCTIIEAFFYNTGTSVRKAALQSC